MLNDNWKAIRSYAYDLVSNKKVCFAHLNEDEKSVLTGLIIKECIPIHAHEYVTEADLNEELPYLLAEYMISKDTNIQNILDKCEILINFMSDKASQYASKRIDEILRDMDIQLEEDKKFYKD